jgi:ATP-dependent helicase/nuclease subunit A
LLVSAAAGSGKTKVLVDRLMSYLTDPHNPANIDDFLIITYTKAAAAELRGKISDKLTQYIAEHPENRHMQQQIQRLLQQELLLQGQRLLQGQKKQLELLQLQHHASL